jgi:signal transduction histidine kinase
LLADFARQAGIAAHAVRLTADLQAARERLVTAREEERRRLRRDLHDGLGPHLASQALTLDAVRDLLRKDPVAAGAVLIELREQTQQAVADIRRIVMTCGQRRWMTAAW